MELKKTIPYSVNIPRIISLWAPRTYANQVHAGMREAGVNAIDAKAKLVEFQIQKKRNQIFDVIITNDGEPLENIRHYVDIGSDHKRSKGARGIFGWGHVCLLSLCLNSDGRAFVETAIDGKLHSWRLFDSYCKELPVCDTSENFGMRLKYLGVKYECDLKELRQFFRWTFTIPVCEKEVEVSLNGKIIASLLPIDTKREIVGDIEIFYVQDKSQSQTYWCHQGIGVYHDDTFRGLLAFINEEHLELQLSKEAYTWSSGYWMAYRRKLLSWYKKHMPKVSYEEKVTKCMKIILKKLKQKLQVLEAEKNAEKPYNRRQRKGKIGSHSKGKTSVEKQNRRIRGVSGCLPIDGGLGEPFLWGIDFPRQLVFNKTHPISKRIADRIEKEPLALGFAVNRGLMSLQLSAEDLQKKKKFYTKIDKETSQRLG